MRKKVLVKEAGFLKFLSSFFKAKADGKEEQWINAVKKQNKELGDTWQQYDDAIDQKWNTFYKILKARNADTSDIEKIMKSRGVKVETKKTF
jgi:predicted transcriptional regulator